MLWRPTFTFASHRDAINKKIQPVDLITLSQFNDNVDVRRSKWYWLFEIDRNKCIRMHYNGESIVIGATPITIADKNGRQ